jgi:hypothetical protein
MKSLILFLAAIIFHLSIQAQSAIGKWRLSTVYTEDEKGKKMNQLEGFEECARTSSFNFTADGKIVVTGGNCPAGQDGVVVGVKYKVEKNKLKLWVLEDDDEPQVYNLQFNGNKMIWTMNFAETKGVKLLQYEFTRR